MEEYEILLIMSKKNFTIIFSTSIEYFLTWKNLLSHGICTYNCLFVIEQQFSNLAMDVNRDVGGDGCLLLI
jgi:hypothetical protein